MSKTNSLKLDDLPSPDELLSVDKLPSPSELSSSQSSGPSMLESLLRGGEQGLAVNFGDELNAALESAASDKPYSQAVDESRKKFEAAKTENPISYMGGQVLGSLLPGGLIAKGVGAGAGLLSNLLPAAESSPAALSALANLSKIVQAGTKGAGGLKGLAAAGTLTGGVEGGLQGAGATEDSSKILQNLPSDVGLGMGIGGAGGTAVGLLGNLLKGTKAAELFKTGLEGTNLSSSATAEDLGKQARNALLDVSKGAKEEISNAGKDIGSALSNIPGVDVSPEIGAFKAGSSQVESMAPYVNKVDRMLKGKEEDPNALYQAYRYLRESANDIGKSSVPDADKSEKIQLLNELKNGLISKMDAASSEAAQATGTKSLPEARESFSKLMNIIDRFAPGAKDKSSLDADTYSTVEKGLQAMLTRAEGSSASGLVTKAELDEVHNALKDVAPELADKFAAAKAPIEKLALRSANVGGIKNVTGAGANLAGVALNKAGSVTSKVPLPDDLFKPGVAEAVSNVSPTMGNMLKRLQDSGTAESQRRAYQNILLNNPVVREVLLKDSDK